MFEYQCKYGGIFGHNVKKESTKEIPGSEFVREGKRYIMVVEFWQCLFCGEWDKRVIEKVIEE